MKLKSILMFVAGIVGGLSSQLAPAQSILYLSNTNTGGATVNTYLMNGTVFDISITTGNNAGGYTLDSIGILLATNFNADGRKLNVTIGNGSTHNSLQGNFDNDTLPSAGGFLTFTPDSYPGDTSLLAANTIYTLVLYSFLPNGGPAGPFYLSTASVMPTGPDNWGYGNFGENVPPPSGDQPIFYIMATPVAATPEPSILGLAAFGSIASFWLFRGRK